jgi:hypothetical protein
MFDDTVKFCSDDGTSLEVDPSLADTVISAPAPADTNQPHPTAEASPDKVAALQKDLETKLENYEASQHRSRNISIILLVTSLLSWGVYYLSRSGPSVRPSVQPSYVKTTTPGSGIAMKIDSKPGEPVWVSQDPIRMAQPIMINGKQVEGSIEIKNTAHYPAGQPACAPTSAGMEVIHRKPTLAGWQYLKDTNISYRVDGVEMKPGNNGIADVVRTMSQSQPTPVEDHGEYVEKLNVYPACELWQKIADSHSTQIKIGNASVDLSDHDRAGIKEFVLAIGLK